MLFKSTSWSKSTLQRLLNWGWVTKLVIPVLCCIVFWIKFKMHFQVFPISGVFFPCCSVLVSDKLWRIFCTSNHYCHCCHEYCDRIKEVMFKKNSQKKFLNPRFLQKSRVDNYLILSRCKDMWTNTFEEYVMLKLLWQGPLWVLCLWSCLESTWSTD